MPNVQAQLCGGIRRELAAAVVGDDGRWSCIDVRYSIGIFSGPMRQELGWSAELILLGFLLLASPASSVLHPQAVHQMVRLTRHVRWGSNGLVLLLFGTGFFTAAASRLLWPTVVRCWAPTSGCGLHADRARPPQVRRLRRIVLACGSQQEAKFGYIHLTVV